MKQAAIVFLTFIFSITVCLADQNYYSSENQIKIAEINPSEKWVKLYNTGETTVDLAGWVFYDDNDKHEFFITLPDVAETNKEKTLMLAPYSEIIITNNNDNDFELHQEGGEVRLFSGPVEIEGKLEDKIIYPEVKEGESYVVISNYQLPIPNEMSNENTGEISNENSGSVLKPQENQEDIQYKIPEERGNYVKLSDNKNNSSPENNIPETNSLGKGRANSNNNAEDNNTETMGQSNNPPTFTASSGLQKTPYAWFYRLWGNWFLWRIILPFLGLWTALYIAAHFIKKKYFS